MTAQMTCGFYGTYPLSGRRTQVVVPGAGAVLSNFARRVMHFSHDDELTTPMTELLPRAYRND